MNEQTDIPPQIPPQNPVTNPPPPPNELRSLGDDPAERVPIANALAAIEALLRQPRRLLFQLRQPKAGKLIGEMIFITLGCSLVYGVVAGTFSGGRKYSSSAEVWTS